MGRGIGRTQAQERFGLVFQVRDAASSRKNAKPLPEPIIPPERLQIAAAEWLHAVDRFENPRVLPKPIDREPREFRQSVDARLQLRGEAGFCSASFLRVLDTHDKEITQ